jgi:hypothetical protein
MPRTLAAALVVAALTPTVASAQSTATIRGVIVDSMRQPVSDVDVRALPGLRRVRTDSTGAFVFGALEAGQYTVRARRIGYAPVDWSVQLPKGGSADLRIELGPRIARLDTVRVVAGRTCDAKSYEGFLCRQVSARGAYLDYTDIDTAQVYYSADLLRDVGGFGTTLVPTRYGPARIPTSRECTVVLMNGAPVSWTTIPDAPYMISAIEVYKSRAEIPKEFQRYMWGKERCWLVAYWTYDFMMKPIRKLGLPYSVADTRQ